MKRNLVFVLYSAFFLSSFVIGTKFIRKLKTNVFLKCVNPSWTFFYKGLQFKEIIDTYETEPSFLVSPNDLSTMKDKFHSWDKTKVTLVLSLEAADIRKLLMGPFRTSLVKENEVKELIARFALQTGSPLKYSMVPHGTPASIIEALSGLKVKILYRSGTVDSETDLNSFCLQDFVVFDLSQNGFNLIMKLGKYLDETGNDLFSLKECLNITQPRRAQLGGTLSFNDKLATVKSQVLYDSGSQSYSWSLRKSHILEDSMIQWRALTSPTLFLERIIIYYRGEIGIDAGGLYKDWFSSVTKVGFGIESKYFETIKSDAYFSIPKSSVANHDYFNFLGSFMAKVVINGKTTECNFPNFLLKLMMGKRPGFHEMKQIFPELFRSFKQLAEMNVPANMGNFSYDIKSEDGSAVNMELIPGGARIRMTDDNKYEFMGLRVKAIVDTPQIKSFVNGFRDLLAVRPTALEIFKPEELRLFITGPVVLDIRDWKRYTEYGNYNSYSSQIIWFWEVLESLDEVNRRKLLRWVTGSSTVPSEGFSALPRKFGIHRVELNRTRDETNFPCSHTCFNYFDLPAFDTKAVLRQRLLDAIEDEGFGMG